METSERPYDLAGGAGNAIDCARLLAAFIVVGIHQHPFDTIVYQYTWGIWSRLAVPFFFICSSYLFFRRCPDIHNWSHYTSRLLKFYTFWCVLFFPWIIHLRWQNGASVIENFSHFIRIFLLDSTFRGSWFIMALIVSVSFAFFSRSVKKKYFILFVALIESFLQFYCYVKDSNLQVGNLLLKANDVYPSFLTSWMSAMIFVALGKYIAENERILFRLSAARMWLLFLVSFCIMSIWVLFLRRQGINNPRTMAMIPTVVFLFLSVLKTKVTLSLPYLNIRKVSSMLFVSHFFFIKVVNAIFHLCGWHGLYYSARYIAVLSLSLCTAVLIVRLQRMRGFDWLKYSW